MTERANPGMIYSVENTHENTSTVDKAVFNLGKDQIEYKILRTPSGMNFRLADKGMSFNAGGYVFNKDRLTRILDALNGKTIEVKALRSKGAKPRTLKVNIVEESENYYISVQGKVYPKTEWEYTMVKPRNEVAKLTKNYWSYETTWYFGDFGTGWQKNQTDNAKSTVSYMLEVLEAVEYVKIKQGNLLTQDVSNEVNDLMD